MVNEIWHDIPDYAGHYQYSNLLRIKSLPHISNAKAGKTKNMKGRILKIVLPFKKNRQKSYAAVTLSKNGIRYSLLVHKFFAEIFIPNPENKKCVNHKNGNKHDYALHNLEWATKSEDLQHAYDTGLKKQKKGILAPLYGRKNGNKHTAKSVIDLETGKIYASCFEAANLNGITPNTLSRYLRGARKNKTSLVYV